MGPGNDHKSKSFGGKDIDVRGEDFLSQLGGTRIDKKDSHQGALILEESAATVPKKTSHQLELPAGRNSRQASNDLAAIDKEIEETLDELERLKFKIVPISRPREPAVEPPLRVEASSDKTEPILTLSTSASGDSVGLSKFSRVEAKECKSMELFRSAMDSGGSHALLKAAITIAILAFILGIIAYQLYG